METEELYKETAHQGHNLRRERMRRGIKQDAMASLSGVSQSTISKYESMETIDDDLLERFAKALEIPIEKLKNGELECLSFFIENNTFENNDKATAGEINMRDENIENITYNNPLDKVTELYERLLQDQKDLVASLQKRVSELEEQLKKIK